MDSDLKNTELELRRGLCHYHFVTHENCLHTRDKGIIIEHVSVFFQRVS